MMLTVGRIALLFILATTCSSQSDRCFNPPTGQEGSCVIIHSCPAVLNLLKEKPLRPATIQRLQNAQCGYEQTTPKVCCPFGGGQQGQQVGQNNQQRPPNNNNQQRPPNNNNQQRPPNNNNNYNNQQQPVNNNNQRPPNNNNQQRPPVNPQAGGARPGPVALNHPRINMLPLDSCGVSQENRIVNGKRAILGQFPWMARIGYITRTGESFRCGGSIISKRYVLTAAHCISNLPNSLRLTSVQLGEHDATMDPDCETNLGIYTCNPSPQKFNVEKAIPHPQYSASSVQNDIGLIRLDRDADLTVDSVRAVCLPVGNIQFKNLDNAQGLTVSGWGTTENGSSSQTLLYVGIPSVPVEQCKNIYSKQAAIIPSQICAGGATQDSCDGDSGGPLTIPDAVGNDPSPRTVQVGIVSFGPVRCGTQGMPGVYTRVGHYMQWILDNMQP